MYSVQYRDDEICAISYFDKTGKLHSNEKVDSTTKEIICYYKSGKIAARIPFHNGIYNGKYATYYPSGQLINETSYVNDYREGLAKSCFESGSVKELMNWHNGSRHGNYALYFANGKKAIEGGYHAGKRYGKWLFYNESGKIVETLSYFDDEIYEIN
jgi:antitoxin component YwqK of YwqJK toxin-antitoxin module